jgi:hypothetical protein
VRAAASSIARQIVEASAELCDDVLVAAARPRGVGTGEEQSNGIPPENLWASFHNVEDTVLQTVRAH